MSSASDTIAMGTAPVPVDPRAVDAAMIRGLYRRVRPLIVANFGALGLLTFALWGQAATGPLLGWAVALGLWTLLRFGLARAYMRRERTLEETWRWTLAFAVGATVAGLLWGSAVVFVEDLASGNGALVTAFLMAALSAAAIAGYTNSLLAFAGFITPALLPYGLRLVSLNGSPSFAVALFLVFWGVLLWMMARHLNDDFRSSIALSLRNGNLAERLRAERNRAEAANRAKSRFLGHMSHELRTPLNAVIGYAEMMQHKVLGPLGNETYDGYTGTIVQSGRHMLSMIEGILALSAAEDGELDIELEPTDLGALALACGDAVREHAGEAGVAIDCTVEEGLPPVRGHAGSLGQIIRILVDNAVRFAGEGGHVRVAAGTAGPDAVELSVTDDGRGMTPEMAAMVQLPFAQMEDEDPLARPEGRHADGGSGLRLNLPLARLLTEAHHGRFTVRSAPGEGTTVTIRLPAMQDRSAGLDGDRGTPPATRSGAAIDAEAAAAVECKRA